MLDLHWTISLSFDLEGRSNISFPVVDNFDPHFHTSADKPENQIQKYQDFNTIDLKRNGDILSPIGYTFFIHHHN